MKLHLFSDLHFEHQADRGHSFVRSLDTTGIDAVVLAGDLCTVGEGLLNALGLFAAKYPRVLFVPGNHEYYGSDRGRVHATLKKAQQRHPNLHVLDNDVLMLDGRRILGTTLWFPSSEIARLGARTWSDFSCITGFNRWVWDAHETARTFLRREMREGDIVITHYLPSQQSIHPRWAESPSNCYFVGDVESLILERKPALWLHGHTHESLDYMLGDTRVVCNPFGYAMLGMLNDAFQEPLKLVL